MEGPEARRDEPLLRAGRQLGQAAGLPVSSLLGESGC